MRRLKIKLMFILSVIPRLIPDNGYPHDGRADKNPYPIRILIRTTAIISALS